MLNAFVILDYNNCIKELVLTVGINLYYFTRKLRRNHKSVFNDRSFGESSVNLTALKLVTDFNLHCNIPQLLVIKSRNRRTTVNKRTCFFFNSLQRSFDTVKDVVNNTGAEKNIHRSTGTLNGIARFKSCCFLINLNSCDVVCNTDDFTDKLLLAYMNHFHHLKAVGIFYGNNRSVYSIYNIVVFHIITISFKRN